MSDDLMGRAFANWIDRFADQRFSLTGALTFEIMCEARTTQAFAFDQDFVPAGFTLSPW